MNTLLPAFLYSWILALQMTANSDLAHHGIRDDTIRIAFNQNDIHRADLRWILVERSVADTGLTIDWLALPGPRVLSSLKNNEIDAAIAFSWSPARQSYGVYPYGDNSVDKRKKLFSSRYAIYTKKGNNTVWNGKNFKSDTTVAVRPRVSIMNTLQSMNVNIYQVFKDEDETYLSLFLKLLENDRVDAVVDNSINIQDLDKSESILPHPIPFKEKEYYLLFSHHYYNDKRKKAETIWDSIADNRDVIWQECKEALAAEGVYSGNVTVCNR